MEKWHGSLSHMVDIRDDDNTQQVRGRRRGILTSHLFTHQTLSHTSDIGVSDSQRSGQVDSGAAAEDGKRQWDGKGGGRPLCVRT